MFICANESLQTGGFGGVKKGLTVIARDNEKPPEGWKIAAIEDIAEVNPRIDKVYLL